MNFFRIIFSIICLVSITTVAKAQYPPNFQKRPDIRLAATDGTAWGCGGYWEWLPLAYNYPENSGKKFPLIIFLNGASEAGSGNSQDLDLMTFGYSNYPTAAGLSSLCASGTFPEVITAPSGVDYSFMVMSLQCFGGVNVLPKHIEPYIDYFINNYRVDPSRIFLTGISVGGTRAWSTAGTNKATSIKFAAVVPIDGGADGDYVNCPNPVLTDPCRGDASMYNRVISTLDDDDAPKTLAIHGETDFNRPFGDSYVKGINRPGNAKVIYFPGGHGSWGPAYQISTLVDGGMNIYQWMLAQADLLLPVTLTDFDALAVDQSIRLEWSTSSESNSSYFSVERSSNGKDFKEIGRVKASGNSTTAKKYRFTDNAPMSGNNYYRLKMVDLDATFKWSEIRKVSMNGSDLEFSFGPNPVLNEASIMISGKQRTRLNVTVTDLMGRTMRSMSFSKTESILNQKMNLADLPAGQYVLSIKGDNVSYTQRIIKR